MRVFTLRSKKLFFTVCAIVYCLKSIGLAPFSVRIEKPARMNCHSSVQAFFISKAGQAYNILLLIPMTVIPSLHLSFFKVGDSPYEILVANILSAISTAKIIIFIITSCVIILFWAFGQKRAACVLNRMLEVDVRFSGLRKRPFNKRPLIFLALHIILNACLWITYSVMITTLSEEDNLPLAFVSRLPVFIYHWFMIEYITVVGLLSQDLETVNYYLLDFKEFGSYLTRSPIRNNVLIVSLSNNSSSQAASLKLLRNVRTTLYELCEDIADFFSFPILFCIASCFISIFAELYKMSRTALLLPPIRITGWALILLLKHIYPVVSLALNVTQTKKVAGLTGQIVHKLLAEARTDEIKAELEQFSLQLLHEKPDFTAYGLFTLDSTLLQSMLAGVATYAIILMQFESSVCNCNCNCNRNWNWNNTFTE